MKKKTNSPYKSGERNPAYKDKQRSDKTIQDKKKAEKT